MSYTIKLTSQEKTRRKGGYFWRIDRLERYTITNERDEIVFSVISHNAIQNYDQCDRRYITRIHIGQQYHHVIELYDGDIAPLNYKEYYNPTTGEKPRNVPPEEYTEALNAFLMHFGSNAIDEFGDLKLTMVFGLPLIFLAMLLWAITLSNYAENFNKLSALPEALSARLAPIDPIEKMEGAVNGSRDD